MKKYLVRARQTPLYELIYRVWEVDDQERPARIVADTITEKDAIEIARLLNGDDTLRRQRDRFRSALILLDAVAACAEVGCEKCVNDILATRSAISEALDIDE